MRTLGQTLSSSGKRVQVRPEVVLMIAEIEPPTASPLEQKTGSNKAVHFEPQLLEANTITIAATTNQAQDDRQRFRTNPGQINRGRSTLTAAGGGIQSGQSVPAAGAAALCAAVQAHRRIRSKTCIRGARCRFSFSDQPLPSELDSPRGSRRCNHIRSDHGKNKNRHQGLSTKQ